MNAQQHQLRFDSLFNPGRGFTFPCDERGNVNLDFLTEGARRSYFYAHTLIGRDFARPVVQPFMVQ